MEIRQKVRELGVALIKVSVGVRRMELRRRLEIAAFDLVQNAAIGNFEAMLSYIEAIEEMLKFGRTIYEVEPITAETVIAECGNCRDMVRQIAGLDFRGDITSLFKKENIAVKVVDVPSTKRERRTREANSAKTNAAKQNAAIPRQARDIYDLAIGNAAILRQAQDVSGALPNTAMPGENTAIDDDAAMRQSAIVDKMRQMGNKQVQLKDIVAQFDGVSERTIRYDIQKLCSQGILERLGTGGPGTYYRIRVL